MARQHAGWWCGRWASRGRTERSSPCARGRFGLRCERVGGLGLAKRVPWDELSDANSRTGRRSLWRLRCRSARWRHNIVRTILRECPCTTTAFRGQQLPRLRGRRPGERKGFSRTCDTSEGGCSADSRSGGGEGAPGAFIPDVQRAQVICARIFWWLCFELPPDEQPVCEMPQDEEPESCEDEELDEACTAVTNDCFIDPDTHKCRSREGRCDRSGGYCPNTTKEADCKCRRKR